MQDEQDIRSEQDGDVEAHGARFNGAPAEAADVQAHSVRGRGRSDDGPPPQETEREQPTPRDEDDDVEAHRSYWSDERLKQDVRSLQDDADEEVEGHVARSGRRNEDGPPPQETERELSRPDEDDDVEGHRAYSSSDERLKQDVRSLQDDAGEDVEGHVSRGRGRNDDGPPSQETESELSRPDEDDDVEGHRAYSGSDGRWKTGIRSL